MPKASFDLQTTLSPQQVLEAFTDFTERRPELWPGLSRKYYKVYSIGDDTAEVREGTDGVNIWARERYDWSEPGVLSWTVQESNFSRPGDGCRITIEPSETGSTLHVDWWRHGSSFKGKILIGLIGLLRARPVAESINKGLRQIEQMP